MIAFLSTSLTPHQIPFCNEMHHLCDEFWFIQFNKIGKQWISKNAVICREDYKYLLSWNDETEYCKKIIMEADAVIIGSVDLKFVKDRLKKKKLTFVYLERFYKEGITFKNILKAVGGTFIHHGIFQKYKPYLLCASAYCAGDAKIFGNYTGRMFKWGYFPKTSALPANYSVLKEKNSILWVGRLIDWKHPEILLKTAHELKTRHIECHIKIIGTGCLENTLREQITKADLSDIIEMCGEMPANLVKEEMNKAEIFVTTSDYREGWGAVLNEAMDSECAVVASHAAGSTPFLVKHGQNGLIYQSGDSGQLTEYIIKLLSDGGYASTLGKNASNYVRTVWSPKEAAKRLLKKCENINEDLYEDGPMSIAEPIKQREMYGRSIRR